MKATKFSLMAVIALGSALTMAPWTRAQDTPAPDAKPKPSQQRQGAPRGQAERMKQIAEELKLSDEQKTKLEAVTKEENEKLRALRADTNLSQEDRRTKARSLREELAGKVKPILSPEQFEKWEKMRRNAGPGARQRAPRGGNGGAAKPADEQPKN